MNLTESLQQHFGYKPLQKIDPDTQEVKPGRGLPLEQRFSQAVIPVVLTGIRRFTSTDEGAKEILLAENDTDWVSKLFPGHGAEIVVKVAAYGGHSQKNTYAKLNEVADKAVLLIKQAVEPDNKIIAVKKIMEAEISRVLTYLPASLHLGKVLDENTIDDRTKQNGRSG